jgi:hypothetical protein
MKTLENRMYALICQSDGIKAREIAQKLKIGFYIVRRLFMTFVIGMRSITGMDIFSRKDLTEGWKHTADIIPVFLNFWIFRRKIGLHS